MSALALTVNDRLGCKGLAVTNTLAYFGTKLITAVKIFMIQTPGYVR